ncbi:response regulator transcription factor [Paenibacillus nasutitermitis]|uniref:AraC family transcriptional regulator n=1 Tax=Paenibacillus nasutitermitis TaxID=1652958 RepID=A0A917DMB7_9BACL|nr:response regulator [Paenibacillus nasutitermitis]GGD50069.1 AraC family transcriptional regulator [Paenibacillus nasutitermitis]
MLKIIIVDDELLLRTNIKLMVDWQSNGFELCAEATNGVEALSLIGLWNPAIIISDIRMPVMDGLQLSKEINEKFPHIKLIVLSNFDDFEYVRGTLKNGAIDYLLKHSLNEQVILESLERAKSHYYAQSSGVVNEKTQLETRSALKQKFLIGLLTGYIHHEAEAKGHIRALGLQMELTRIIPVILEIDHFQVLVAERGLREETILQFAIENVIEEVLEDHGNGVLSHVSGGRFVILFSFSAIRSAALLEEALRFVLTRIDLCLKRFVKLSASISIGMMCDRIANLPASYEKAIQSLSEKFYQGKNVLVRSGEKEAVRVKVLGISTNDEKNLLANLRLRDQEAVYSTLSAIFGKIKEEKIAQSSAKMMFNEMLGILSRVSKESMLDISKIYKDKESPFEKLTRLETLNEVQDWILLLYERTIIQLKESNKSKFSVHVKIGIDFVERFYHRNISLTHVADEIGWSANYFSSQFKDEVGIGFSEYLNDYRVGKAKAMIIQGEKDLKEIIRQCGFNNYPYFFQVFKRRTGMTPKSFMENNPS